MTTAFPTALDTLTNPASTDQLDSVTVPHAAQHANANDSIEALEAKVGINSSAVTTSLDYKTAAALNPLSSALGNVTGATTITMTAATRIFSATTTGATTWTFAGAPTSGLFGWFALKLTNGGSQTQTWPASVDWDGGTAPPLTTSGDDWLLFYTLDGGAPWFGALSIKGAA